MRSLTAIFLVMLATVIGTPTTAIPPGSPNTTELYHYKIPQAVSIIKGRTELSSTLATAVTKQFVINCTGKKALTDLFTTKAMFFFAYLVIFFTSICGNSLVIYVVFTSKNMQTVTNIFITNLAISDLLVSCTSLWLTPVYTYIGHWIWGGWLCYGLPLFQGTSIFISTLTLMSIAVDRYFVICRHSKYIVNINERMSMHVCIAIITLIWMVSLLLVMPYAVHMRMAYVQQPCDFWLCIEDWAMEDLKSLYGVIVLCLQFAVPFVIIGYSYVRIWCFLNQRRRKSRRAMLKSERESETETQRMRRLLRMLVTMVVLFVICWFPFNLLNILRDLKMDTFLKPYFSFLFLMAHLISMTTTACNPVLYAWMNHSFRDEFVRVVPLLGTICRRLAQSSKNYYYSSDRHRYGRGIRCIKTDHISTIANKATVRNYCGRCRAANLGATALENGLLCMEKVDVQTRQCPHARPQRKSTLLTLLSANSPIKFTRSTHNRMASFRDTRVQQTNDDCKIKKIEKFEKKMKKVKLEQREEPDANFLPVCNGVLHKEKESDLFLIEERTKTRQRRASTGDTKYLRRLSFRYDKSSSNSEKTSLFDHYVLELNLPICVKDKRK